MEIKTLNKITYMALLEMRKGLYLLTYNNAEGLCVGSNLTTFKKPVKAGTIKELLQHKFIRESIHSKNLYLLTDIGRSYTQRDYI